MVPVYRESNRPKLSVLCVCDRRRGGGGGGVGKKQDQRWPLGGHLRH